VQVLPWVVLLNMVIGLAAALYPARLLRDLQPAALLKGD
jgi:putative ABC transport system permease protein